MNTLLHSYLFKNLLMALIYFITGKISFMIFSQDKIVTMAAFAPEGFALAGVLIFGRSILPGIFLGQFILGLSSGMDPLSIFAISLINTIEAYLALLLFQYFKLNRELRSIRDVAGLLLIITFILQPFSAFLGNGILLMQGIITSNAYLHNTFFWWFGNVMGQLLFTPMLLVLYYNRQNVKWINFFYVFIFFLGLNYFLQITLAIDNVSVLLMVTLPTTILITTTNLSYGSVASVVLASISLYFTHLGIGTFSQEITQINNIINLNFFMVSHIVLVLLIGILFREKEEAIKALASMAHYDTLTGLPNRRILKDELHHAIYRAESQDEQSAICFIDVDGFKNVNDTLGHAIGDEVLKEVVKRIKPLLNSQDVFLRLGGDEFLIIANDIRSKIFFTERLKSILSSVDDMQIQGHEIHISLSIGVALCPDNGNSMESLMNNADNAMYSVKERGKNGFIFA